MKRFLRVLILALLAAALSVGCFAESNDVLGIQGISVQDDGGMQVLLYSSIAGSLRPEDFSLTIDNASVAIDSVSPRDPSEGTSWVYLVDTASVSTNHGEEPVKALLEELIKTKKTGDNVAIVTTGKQVEGMELVENAQTLTAMLDSLKENKAVNDLNATIGNVLDFLEGNAEAHEHVCVVVISTGATGNANDMPTSALLEKVRQSNVTVYTVAFVAASGNSNAVQEFGSLADASCGGVEIRVSSNAKTEVPEVIRRITENEGLFRMLSCNPAAQGVRGSNVRLFLDNGSQSGFDSFSLNEAAQKKMEGGIVNESTPEPTATPEPTPYNFFEDIIIFNLSGMEVIIAGGCILLALVILVVAIIVSSKKRRKGNDESMVSVPVTGGVVGAAGGAPSMPVEQHTAPVGGTMPVGGTVPVFTAPAYAEPEQRPVQARPTELNVTLTQIGSHSEGFFSAVMRGQMVVGRDPRNAQLVLPSEDLKISGSHLVLRYEHGAMYAEDISRNGTLLNDVRIYHPTKLHQQDVLTLGNSRYRINWVVNS